MRIVACLAVLMRRRLILELGMDAGVAAVARRSRVGGAGVRVVAGQARAMRVGRASVMDVRVALDADLGARRQRVWLVTLKARVVSVHPGDACLLIRVAGGTSIGIGPEDVRRVAGAAASVVGEALRVHREASVGR